VVTKLDSQTKGRVFKSHPILDGNGFKGLILYPILGKSSNEKNENTGGQTGHKK
jgi:hypothetical protein